MSTRGGRREGREGGGVRRGIDYLEKRTFFFLATQMMNDNDNDDDDDDDDDDGGGGDGGLNSKKAKR